MSTLQFFLLAAVGIILSVEAYHVGYKRGRDRGWLDRQDQLWKEEKARRDQAGRFRSTKLIVHRV